LDPLNKPFSSSMSLQEVAIQEVANFFQVSKKTKQNKTKKKTISRRLADGMPLLYQNKTFYI
jgi:cytochrome c553